MSNEPTHRNGPPTVHFKDGRDEGNCPARPPDMQAPPDREQQLDEALANTFPASDPVASWVFR
jgi:hypothetical protein